MEFKAYFFSTLNTAQDAVKLINKGEGIPLTEDSTTKTYCEPEKCKGGYYIIYDEITAKYLTEPVNIEIETRKM